MGTILDKTAGLLVALASLVDDALAALRAVVSTATPAEDPALSKAVPKIVEVVKSASSNTTTISAMSLLELSAYVTPVSSRIALTNRRHMSSRLLPHAQALITTLLSAAQSATAVSSQAFTTISAVIEAIPTFVSSKQLNSILRASIEQREENDVSTKLLTTSAKKVPTKTLFPVVMDLWKDIQNADASVSFSNLYQELS
jgi:U3 small nucleolar RNA-associated protein 10